MKRIGHHFSTAGLLLGTLFFALSLTPSLLPRGDMVQGVLSGLSMAAGYGVGVLAGWLWTYLELPSAGRHVQRVIQIIAAVFCVLLAISFLWQASHWQNSVRALMGMEEVAGVRALLVGGVALLVFLVALLFGKLFRQLFLLLSRKLRRVVPPRVAHVAGLLLSFYVLWAMAEGVLWSFMLRSADASYQQIDALMEPEVDRPDAPMMTGSEASLLAWDDMGRQGRRFLYRVPTSADIAPFTDGSVRDPIRVYIGLNAAETPEERAALGLRELQRVGGFERSMLVLIAPTGTGWVDPNGLRPLEYLQRGDIASVAAQYSYLPSALSLMSEGAYGVETTRALFQAVYGYWRTLPRDARPRLYLFGMSLGALNSDRSFDFYDIIDEPFDGALWSGPPFRTSTWRNATGSRVPGTPHWLPRFRDGSVIRFANQQGGLDAGEAPWGDFRIAFLQYASDPVTFFSPESFYQEPAWMRAPRGPDVSDDLRWFPIITGLQLLADIGTGTAPPGFGHEISAVDYLDTWWALTEPSGWDAEQLDRLRHYFARRQTAPDPSVNGQ